LIQELMLKDHIKYSRWNRRSLDHVCIKSTWRKRSTRRFVS